jgi:hypothetical protein
LQKGRAVNLFLRGGRQKTAEINKEGAGEDSDVAVLARTFFVIERACFRARRCLNGSGA